MGRAISLSSIALMAMMAAFSTACRADSNADTRGAGIGQPPTHRVLGQRIDQTVARLTRSLDLDREQQARLRQILLDQHRQIMELKSQSFDAGADRVQLNLAILDRTKERIRAMLSEEQKKRYSMDVPRDQTAPAQSDLQHWIGLQESQRRDGKE